MKGKLLLVLLVTTGLVFGHLKHLKAEESTTKKSTLLFQDNFTKINLVKDNWITQSSLWKLTDEGMEINHFDTGGNFTTGDKDWSDYIVEARMKFIERREGENHSGFFLRNSPDGNVQIILRANGPTYNMPKVSETDRGIEKKVEFKNNEWHQFRFICQGQTIEIWIDGKKIGKIADPNIPIKGGIGIYAYNGKVVFSDIRVLSIPKMED